MKTLPPPSDRRSSPPPRRSVPPAAFGMLAAALLPACGAPAPSDRAPAVDGSPLTLAQLDVTQGFVDQAAPGHLHIGEPKVRAVAAVPVSDAAELRFTYRGPTPVQLPLASGEMRQQVGLKLRAEDGCNVVYVMWRVEPDAKLVVSVKRNPGVTSSSECSDHGYKTVAAEWSEPAPVLHAGEAHALAAAIEDGVLVVRIDGHVVWQGMLGEDALSLRGPVGLRSDGVELDDLELVPLARQTLMPTMFPSSRGSISRPPGSSR